MTASSDHSTTPLSRETFRLDGTTVWVLAAGDTTTLLEVALERGSGAPPHRNTREDELVYVLEGILEIDAGGEQRELGIGGSCHFPRGTVHAFTAVTPTRALFLCVPGGLERFFRALAADPPDEAAIAASGVEFFDQS